MYRGTIPETKPYRHPFTDADHHRMAEALGEIKGIAIVSGMDSQLDDELFAG